MLAKALGSAEQSCQDEEDREGHGEGEDGRQQEGEERQEATDGGGGSSTDEQDEIPPTVDWMGRTKHREFPTPGVLSPFVAARRERIVMLPGWVRAFKPWGDFLQVMEDSINVGTKLPTASTTICLDVKKVNLFYHFLPQTSGTTFCSTGRNILST